MTKYEIRTWHADPVAANIADEIHKRLDYGQDRFGPFTDTKNETDILEEVLDTAIYAARLLVELRQRASTGLQCLCVAERRDTCGVCLPDEAGP